MGAEDTEAILSKSKKATGLVWEENGTFASSKHNSPGGRAALFLQSLDTRAPPLLLP